MSVFLVLRMRYENETYINATIINATITFLKFRDFFDVLPNFPFITSEMVRGDYL